jgi:hypothetical protein
MKLVPLLLLCILGCTTIPKLPDAKTTGTIDTYKLLSAVNIFPEKGTIIVDQKYYLVSDQWMRDEFAGTLKKKLEGYRYKQESFDCDNYTLAAVHLASEIGRNKGYQLAIGEFYYLQEKTNRYHVINFYLYEKDNKVNVGFFDPQNGVVITLTQKEIDSCFHWRI